MIFYNSRTWYFRTTSRGRRGRDRMVVEFTITCALSAYHH